MAANAWVEGKDSASPHYRTSALPQRWGWFKTVDSFIVFLMRPAERGASVLVTAALLPVLLLT